MKKKLYVIFGLFVLTLALGVTVKLSENPQEVRRKAAEDLAPMGIGDSCSSFSNYNGGDSSTNGLLRNMTSGDINGDFYPDIVTLVSENITASNDKASRAYIKILTNKKDGKFSTASNVIELSNGDIKGCGNGCENFAVGVLNKDTVGIACNCNNYSRLEIKKINNEATGSARVKVYDGGYCSTCYHQNLIYPNKRSFVADINKDSYRDFVFSNGQYVFIYYGDENGNYAVKKIDYGVNNRVLSLNRRGDNVIVSTWDQHVYIYSIALGSFEEVADFSGDSPYLAAIGDLRGIGKVEDYLYWSNTGTTSSVNYKIASVSASRKVSGRVIVDTCTMDYDDDGKDETVETSEMVPLQSTDGDIGVYKYDGLKTMNRIAKYAVGMYPAGLQCEDLNNDGADDLAVINGDFTVSVWLNCKITPTPTNTPTIMPAEGLCKSVVLDSLHPECLVSCKKTDDNYIGMDKWGADYNCDGDVTGGDFIVWRKEFLDKIVGDFLQSDGNCDNKVSLADYSKWREEYLK